MASDEFDTNMSKALESSGDATDSTVIDVNRTGRLVQCSDGVVEVFDEHDRKETVIKPVGNSVSLFWSLVYWTLF